MLCSVVETGNGDIFHLGVKSNKKTNHNYVHYNTDKHCQN